MKELGNSDYIKDLIDKGIDLGVESGKSIVLAISSRPTRLSITSSTVRVSTSHTHS